MKILTILSLLLLSRAAATSTLSNTTHSPSNPTTNAPTTPTPPTRTPTVLPTTSDENDLCPTDPLKTDPGQCGCGVPDIDTDNDGVADCVDGCPKDFNKQSPGLCGCGNPDTLQDLNHDGIPDCETPGVAAEIQLDQNDATFMGVNMCLGVFVWFIIAVLGGQ